MLLLLSHFELWACVLTASGDFSSCWTPGHPLMIMVLVVLAVAMMTWHYWVSRCFIYIGSPEFTLMNVWSKAKHPYPCFIDDGNWGKERWRSHKVTQLIDVAGITAQDFDSEPRALFSTLFSPRETAYLHISHQQSKYAFLSRSNSFALIEYNVSVQGNSPCSFPRTWNWSLRSL